MKVLPKKRLNQLKLRFLGNLQVASLSKYQLFWYSASITVYAWFVFWIAYDFFVWQKPLLEGNIANYIGATASIALIWAEAKLLKSKQSKPKLDAPKPPQQPQQPKPRKPHAKQTEQPKPQQNPTQTATSLPTQETRTNFATCVHYTGYLKDRQISTQMLDVCLTCTNLLQCLNNRKQTTTTATTKNSTNTSKTKHTKQTTKKPPTQNQKPHKKPKNKKPPHNQQTLTKPKPTSKIT